MRKKLSVTAGTALACAVVVVASIATGETSATKSAGQPEFKLPPGWTEADMQACIEAGTPGEKHQRLAQAAGTWQGKSTMWMVPGAEPMTSDVTATVTPIMDGRFTKCEWKGDSGMGPYSGFGIYGFDNVSQKLVSIWIDNHSTGIMRGEGDISPDGKTTTYEYTHNCPLTKKPTVMRDVETITGPHSKVLEMFATDPKSGKEFKMMRVELTRKEGTTQAGG